MSMTGIPESAYEVVDPRYRPGEAVPMGMYAFDILYFQRNGKWFKSDKSPRLRLKGNGNGNAGS